MLVYLVLGMGLFCTLHFFNIMHWSSGNHDSLNVDILRYITLKHPIHYYHHQSHHKSFKKLSWSEWWLLILINSNFCLKAQILPFPTINTSSLKQQTHFIHFWENVYQIPNLNSLFSLSSENSVPWKKQPVQLKTQKNCTWLSLKTATIFWQAAEVLYAYLPFCHIEY